MVRGGFVKLRYGNHFNPRSPGNNYTKLEQDFKSWNNGSVMNSRTLKGAVSELAACVGPSVSREMIIQLSSS